MGAFRYFAIFAEMRTGSNLLESALNAIDGLQVYGELFNPHFIGGPNREDVFGVSQADRDENPGKLLDMMIRKSAELPGFRIFHDHDPRVIERVIADPECAKVILTRNPVDAFVSRKIAGATGQWRLGDMKDRKVAKIRFDMKEFEGYLADRQAFQGQLRAALQAAGQTAFHLTYEDIQKVEVINGLAAYLGAAGRLKSLPGALKRQNPGPMADKVENLDAMKSALRGLDWLDLDAAPNFEPERGPGVPGFLAAARSSLLFMPVPGGPTDAVRDWLRSVDGDTPISGFVQNSLRKWMADHPGHRAFTVLRHPLARAWDTFQAQVVGEGRRAGVVDVLTRRYGVPGPDEGDLAATFEGFLDLVAGSLAGQTPIRADTHWASQAAILEGFSEFRTPDRVFREDELAEGLGALAEGKVGSPADFSGLSAIYSEGLESKARRIYRRDYLLFGFGDWPSGGL